jgi:hypothetical protein
MHRAIFGPLSLILLLCFCSVSCTSKEDLIVWKAEFPAPDHEYIATAETVQKGGFGPAIIATISAKRFARNL